MTNPTIVKTVNHPAKTECGIDYEVVQNFYSDGSQTIINAPYIPEMFNKICVSQDMTGRFSPSVAFNTRIIEPNPMQHACLPVDNSALLAKLINENPDKWEQITSENDPRIGWFVGQAMKATGGKASPALINSILKQWKDSQINEYQCSDVGC